MLLCHCVFTQSQLFFSLIQNTPKICNSYVNKLKLPNLVYWQFHTIKRLLNNNPYLILYQTTQTTPKPSLQITISSKRLQSLKLTFSSFITIFLNTKVLTPSSEHFFIGLAFSCLQLAGFLYLFYSQEELCVDWSHWSLYKSVLFFTWIW